MNEAKIGFEMRKIKISLDDILPVRQITSPGKTIQRYKTILDSLKEVGLVEPLIVHPQPETPGKYLLLDGHLRHAALKELGNVTAECLIATDDECFTYNARVSRLPAVQEHKMILKAVRDGVRPERIAAALNISPRVVLASMKLLDGIHEEAADLLKDKHIAPKTIRLLKRVNAVRQIEIAELMVSANNFTNSYADALILGTPKDQMINPAEPKKREGLSAEEIGRMEEEMEVVQHDLKAIEDTYGVNMLNLTLARGYIKKLLDNAKVVRFLSASDPEILNEFQEFTAIESL